jgi:hypothetical protein
MARIDDEPQEGAESRAGHEPQAGAPEPQAGAPEPQAGAPGDRPARNPRAMLKDAASVLRAYRTESAIYGVVLVSSLVAIGWYQESDLEVLVFTVGAMVVFWLAHVYAGTISREESDSPRLRAILAAARASAAHTSGMLLAMVLPTIFLLLAVVNVLDEYVAYYLALWVGTAVLAVIGWFSAKRRGGHWGWWLLSALVTASLGIIMIWLGSLVH